MILKIFWFYFRLFLVCSICGISPASADIDTDPEVLRERMRSVSVDNFVNGFIVHCLSNIRKIEKIENLLDVFSKQDYAFKLDDETASVMVDGDHVLDQEIWFLLLGMGTPAFVGLYDANLFGVSAKGCSFSNTRFNSDGVLEKLLGLFPNLLLLKDADSGVRYEAILGYSSESKKDYLIRFGASSVDSIHGGVLEVYWPAE